MRGQVESGVALNDITVSRASVHEGLNFFAFCLVLYHLLIVHFLPPAFAVHLVGLTLGMHEVTLAVVVLVMDRLYTGRPFFIRSVIWWLLVVFVFTLYLSAFGPGAVERNQSLIIFKKILRYLIPGFVLLNTVPDWKRLRVLLWFVILCAFLATVVGFWQFAVKGPVESVWYPFGGVAGISRSNPQFMFVPKYVDSWRFGGPGGIARVNPDFFCLALFVVIPLTWYFYITAKKTYLRYGCITIYSVFVMGLLLSGSRSALLGFAVICIGAIWRWKRRFITIMAVTVTLVFVIVLFHPYFRQRVRYIVGRIERPPQAQAIKREPSDELTQIRLPGGIIVSQSRIRFWKTSLDMFLDHPVFGIGIVTFARAYGERVAPARGYTAHNSLLLVFVEAGIIGGTMFLVLLGVVIRTLRRLAKEALGGIGNANASILAGALELGFYGVFVNAFFHDQIYRIHLYLLIVFVVILQKLTKSEGTN